MVTGTDGARDRRREGDSAGREQVAGGDFGGIVLDSHTHAINRRAANGLQRGRGVDGNGARKRCDPPSYGVDQRRLLGQLGLGVGQLLHAAGHRRTAGNRHCGRGAITENERRNAVVEVVEVDVAAGYKIWQPVAVHVAEVVLAPGDIKPDAEGNRHDREGLDGALEGEIAFTRELGEADDGLFGPKGG